MRFRNPTVILSNNNERRILNQNRTETQGEGDKMKKLYLINGTMEVGKTTIGQILKKKMNKSVFLDGDWCWDSHPFQVTDETKAMVIDNICYLLNNFLRCTAYENIVFCWVMDRQEIIDTVLNRLDTENVDVKIVSLVCSEEALTRRIDKDVRADSEGFLQSKTVSAACLPITLWTQSKSTLRPKLRKRLRKWF